jgi:hypothetical protein
MYFAAFAALVATATADTTPYHVYTANLSALSGSGVSAEVTVFVTPSGVVGIGSAHGLEANLSTASNCTANNACGAHIHSGNACTDTSTQGGHYYDTSVSDPWGAIKYESTNGMGIGHFDFEMTTSATDVDGKTFIVHNNAGARVACGILSLVDSTSATLAPLSGGSVQGGVTIYSSSSKIVGAGWASGLEANLLAFSKGGTNCTSGNGCGVHVHSGTNCVDSAGQGGHLQTLGGTDPWGNIRYGSTNANGNATFCFEVLSDNTDVLDKPFIAHNDAGGRVACGILSSGTSAPAPAAAGTTMEATMAPTTTVEANATTLDSNATTSAKTGAPAPGMVGGTVANAVPLVTLSFLAFLL